jgi:superfamily II DNA or RNA helicase
MKYESYISNKMKSSDMVGMEPPELNKKLFPYQADLVRWALRRGRAALFADTGLGKTFMQVEWARCIEGRVLILAPLAVAEQTVREAKKLGIEIAYRRKDEGDRITITNYEMMDYFDPANFNGICLDESSIIKAYTGKIREQIITQFNKVPFKLACTATPSPNDYTELGNHSEFLGIKTRPEMLAEYFVHDMENTQEWRLKGHAIDAFWRWVSTWGALIRKPSDLGYSDKGFELPPLIMKEEVVEISNVDAWKEGELFALEVKTLSDQRTTRRATMETRVQVAELLSRGKEPVIIWCELNDEADMVTEAVKGAVQVQGSDTPEQKAKAMLDFSNGDIRVLVSKTKICGFGMNWQHCHKMIFMGASHSYEGTYQAIRRCWRFGQKQAVEVTVIRASTEGAIIENFKRKEADAISMGEEMALRVKDVLLAEIKGTKKEWNPYDPQVKMIVPSWIGEEA